MAGKAIDDSALITQIEDLMRNDPGLSQRAAILRVAGEGALRRIQNKMTKRPAVLPADAGSGVTTLDLGANELEKSLLEIERQALVGTGETVELSCFSDSEALRLRDKGKGINHPANAKDFMDKAGVYGGVATFILFPLLVVLDIYAKSLEGADPAPLLDWLIIWVFGPMALVPFSFFVVAVADKASGPAFRRYMEERTLRYVLTERCLHVINLQDQVANIRRIPRQDIASVRQASDGDLSINVGSDEIMLPLPRRGDDLARLLKA